MFALLLAIASAPLPMATGDEERVANDLDLGPLKAIRPYPGGPIVAVSCIADPDPESVRLLERLPSLAEFIVHLPAPADRKLDLARLRGLRRVRLPSQYLDCHLTLPDGVQELTFFTAGRSTGLARAQADRLARESASVVRFVAGLPRLESLDLADVPLAPGTVGRLSSKSLRRLAVLECDPGELAWLPALEGLRITGEVNDRALVAIGRMTRLERLSLEHGGFTVRGLSALRGLAALRSLRLDGPPFGPQVGDDGLAFLRGLRHLEHLDLRHMRLDDEALRHLAALPRLRDLHLEGNRIQGHGLAHLAGLPIEKLFLGGEPLRADGLRHLAALPRLRELDLSSSGEGRDLLPGLGSLHGLHDLSLNYTGATDAGLVHLAGMPELREVRLQETRVTAEAVDRLRKDRPELHVHRREPGK